MRILNYGATSYDKSNNHNQNNNSNYSIILFSVLSKLCSDEYFIINIFFTDFRSTSQISDICAAFAGYGTGLPVAVTSTSADHSPTQCPHTLPNTHPAPPRYKRTVAPRALEGLAGISITFRALIMTTRGFA